MNSDKDGVRCSARRLGVEQSEGRFNVQILLRFWRRRTFRRSLEIHGCSSKLDEGLGSTAVGFAQWKSTTRFMMICLISTCRLVLYFQIYVQAVLFLRDPPPKAYSPTYHSSDKSRQRSP